MINKELKLSVKNLKISFRTDGGKVQAVRNVDFDLYKGETLAIVGESGSGKSVTNRAIMGILAPNAIKESGEIIYDGQDLMKITEEDFHSIRGDKIAMIFQDPMSSLNPIMKVGKQLTEAMIIKGKIRQKESRKYFNKMLARLNFYMDEASDAKNNPEIKHYNSDICKKFNAFEYKHLQLESAYNKAIDFANDAIESIDDVLFRIEKSANKGLYTDIENIIRFASRTYNEYVVFSRADELKYILSKIKKVIKVPFKQKCLNFVRLFSNRVENKDIADFTAASELLKIVREILNDAIHFTLPNFFAMGYYLTFSKEPLPDMPVSELNVFLRKYLDDNFMLDFISHAKSGIEYAYKVSGKAKEYAVSVIDDNLPIFEKDTLVKQEVEIAVRAMINAVEKSINKLAINKDNMLYTFKSSIKAAKDSYFGTIKRNEKERERYEKQKAVYDKKVAMGKTPDYEVAEMNLVDTDTVKNDLVNVISRVKLRLIQNIENEKNIDFQSKTIEIIDYFKEKASGVVYRVTRNMAKIKALKLLKEVGIPDPSKRYKQYPFEFSGGMRQRIVIAIALAANPDILICDEPTTALDVTIQSQILELINKVKEERKLSVIFITHDLGVVANMADRVAVMYAGKIVEVGTADDIFYKPAHPYTWALLASMPDLDTKEKLGAIPGTPPNMIYPPKGDAFAERSQYAMQIDFEQQPPMFKISETHSAATWLLHPNAPKVDPPKIVTDRIERMKKRGLNSND